MTGYEIRLLTYIIAIATLTVFSLLSYLIKVTAP